jgi:hypothetical protein
MKRLLAAACAITAIAFFSAAAEEPVQPEPKAEVKTPEVKPAVKPAPKAEKKEPKKQDAYAKLSAMPDRFEIPDGTAFKEAVDYLAKTAGVKIEIDSSAKPRAKMPLKGFAVETKSLTWAEILGKILAQQKLRYTVQDDVVHIATAQAIATALTAPPSQTTPEEETASEPMTVGSVVAATTSFAAPELGIYPEGPYIGMHNYGPFAYNQPFLTGGMPTTEYAGMPTPYDADVLIIPGPQAYSPSKFMTDRPYFPAPDYMWPFWMRNLGQPQYVQPQYVPFPVPGQAQPREKAPANLTAVEKARVAMKANPKLTGEELLKILESEEKEK